MRLTGHQANTSPEALQVIDTNHCAEMCSMGVDGWELVEVDSGRGFFKRRKKA